jgi:hypothetical protein
MDVFVFEWDWTFNKFNKSDDSARRGTRTRTRCAAREQLAAGAALGAGGVCVCYEASHIVRCINEVSKVATTEIKTVSLLTKHTPNK